MLFSSEASQSRARCSVAARAIARARRLIASCSSAGATSATMWSASTCSASSPPASARHGRGLEVRPRLVGVARRAQHPTALEPEVRRGLRVVGGEAVEDPGRLVVLLLEPERAHVLRQPRGPVRLVGLLGGVEEALAGRGGVVEVPEGSWVDHARNPATATPLGQNDAHVAGAVPACAPAPPVHRGRPADPRGAQLLAARQPLHPQPAAGVGRPPRGLGDPRRGRRRRGLPAAHVVRPRGAAGRRDRLRGRGGDRRARRGPPVVRRAGAGGLEARASPRPWPRWPRPARRTCGSARSTRSGRSSTSSRPGSLAGLWTFFPDPWPKTRHHKRRLVDASFAALGRVAAGTGRDLAAGHRLGRLRRPDARGARRPARADRWGRGALGGAAGDEVRAQGPRGRPRRSPTSPTPAPDPVRGSGRGRRRPSPARARRAAARSHARARR